MSHVTCVLWEQTGISLCHGLQQAEKVSITIKKVSLTIKKVSLTIKKVSLRGNNKEGITKN